MARMGVALVAADWATAVGPSASALGGKHLFSNSDLLLLGGLVCGRCVLLSAES